MSLSLIHRRSPRIRPMSFLPFYGLSLALNAACVPVPACSLAVHPFNDGVAGFSRGNPRAQNFLLQFHFAADHAIVGSHCRNLVLLKCP